MIALRRANAGDARDVFEWRNDPRTREASLSRAEIVWDDHEAWFIRAIADPGRRLYIAEAVGDSGPPADGAIGMVRFDRRGGEAAEVSINLNPSWRGRGVSVEVLESAIAELSSSGMSPELHATIRAGNTASVRLFLRAGFVEVSREADVVMFRRDAGFR